MKKSAFILLAVALILAAAASAISVKFTITSNGMDNVTFSEQKTIENCTANPETNATACVNETVAENSTMLQPWNSSQDVEVSCEGTCNYDIPVFIKPSSVKIKNYTIDYADKTDYAIVFLSTNKTMTKDSEDKIHIDLKSPEAEAVLQIDRIAPKNLTIGNNQVNVIVRNKYFAQLTSVTATISGSGIQTTDAVPIQTLAPGDKDYVILKISASESGTKDVVVQLSAEMPSGKISVKYLDQFFVMAPPAPATPQETVNASLLFEQFNQTKELLNGLESQYLDKKSRGYLVSEIYDSIKNVKDNLQSAQFALADGKFKDAQKYLLLAQSGLDDVKSGIENAVQPQKTFLDKVKDNALLITTISAAIVAVISMIERQKNKVKALREKLRMKKEMKFKKGNSKAPETEKQKPSKPLKKSKKKVKESHKESHDEEIIIPDQ